MAETRSNLTVKVELDKEAVDKLVAIAQTARSLADQIDSFSGHYNVMVVPDKAGDSE